jgi:type II secretory pathway component GspD/PulD (secretin)
MKPLHYMLIFVICIHWFCLPAQEPAAEAPPKPDKVIIRADAEEKRIYKMIPLATLDFKTVDAVCASWLSKEGKLVYEEKRNSVLVYDTEYVVNKIETFIRNNDREAVNIRIEIDKTGGGATGRNRFAIDNTMPRQQPVTVYQNGKKVSFSQQPMQKIDLSSSRGYESSNSKQFIVTKSGCAATLWSGVTMIDPSWYRNQKMNPSVIVVDNSGGVTRIDGTPDNPVWTDVGTSLMVLPRQLENGLIEVEVYPEISYLAGKGKRQSVKVESLSTRVTVQNGARVNIGGVISGKSKAYVNIFGPEFFKSKDISQVMSMYLTATIMEPGKTEKFGGRNWPPR